MRQTFNDAVPLMRQVRVAVVGAGLFGLEHIASYRVLAEVELVGVVEPDEARRFALVSSGAVPSTLPLFSSVREMLAAGEVDAASIVVPSRLHAVVASELMAAGVDILVEKPFTETVDDAQQIAREAAQLGRVCLPGHVLRFSPQHQALRARIRAKTMGDVIAVALRRDRSRVLTMSHAGEHPASLTGVHDIDLAIWLTGQRVAEVRASEHRMSDGHGIDLFWAELLHVDGAMSSIRGAYLLPADTPDATSDQIDVYGSTDIETLHDETPRRGGSKSAGNAAETHNVPLMNELAHFVACVAAGTPSSICKPEDAIHVVEVVHAVIQSAAAGGIPVAL